VSRYITHRSPLPGDEARKRGEKVCRWCAKPLPGRRTSWCSVPCVTEYLIRSSGASLRRAVHRRDKGVCAECGFDCDAAKAQASALWYGPGGTAYEALKADLKARGFPIDYGMGPGGWKSFWEADHIAPVVLGGGGCGLDNVRTLCVQCHKKATATLAKQRAEARRAKKQSGDGTLFGVAS
jgi:5-methylcytosine-specific restriction endonuclease McrA